MKYENFTIALADVDEAALADARLAKPADTPLRTSLLSERMGLLAGPANQAQHDDRRMEEWIASHLDLEELSAPKSTSPWSHIIENLPGLKRKPKATRSTAIGRLDARFMEVLSGRVQARDHDGAAGRKGPGQGISNSRAGA